MKNIATDGIRHRHVVEPTYNGCSLCAEEASVWEEVLAWAESQADTANAEVVRLPAENAKRNFYLGVRQMADTLTNLATDRIRDARERRLW